MKKFINIILFISLLFVGLTVVNATSFKLDVPNISFGANAMTCMDVIGPNLSKIIKLLINILRIAGAIIAIVNGILLILPAIYTKDADALKKSEKKLFTMAVVLAIIGIFPSIIKIIADLFGYDVSCIF